MTKRKKNDNYLSKKTHFRGIEKIGDFFRYNPRRKNPRYRGTTIPITSLYSMDGKDFYIFDSIPSSKFRKFYVYKVSEKSIKQFLYKENPSYLLPTERTFVYEVELFDKTVKCALTNHIFAIDYSFFHEDYECIDEKIMKQFFK